MLLTDAQTLLSPSCLCILCDVSRLLRSPGEDSPVSSAERMSGSWWELSHALPHDPPWKQLWEPSPISPRGRHSRTGTEPTPYLPCHPPGGPWPCPEGTGHSQTSHVCPDSCWAVHSTVRPLSIHRKTCTVPPPST